MKTGYKLLIGAALASALPATSAMAQMNQDAPAGATFSLAGTPIIHSFSSYTFNFVASSALTNLTFAFRDDPAYLSLDNVSLTTGGGANLLTNGDFEQGPVNSQAPTGWTYVNQYGASAAGVVVAGVGVDGSLGYYDGAIGAYDAITQAVGTVAGQVYSVSFMLNENSSQSTYLATTDSERGAGINLEVYAQTGIPTLAAAAPEPGTWLMMIVGFGLAGTALRRRKAVRTTLSYAA